MTWTPSPKWRATLNASFLRREQSSEQIVFFSPLTDGCWDRFTLAGRATPPACAGFEVDAAVLDQSQALIADTEDSAIDRDRWGVNLLVNHKLNKRVTIYWNSFWRQEETRGDLIQDRDVKSFRSTLGFRYDFEPVHF